MDGHPIYISEAILKNCKNLCSYTRHAKYDIIYNSAVPKVVYRAHFLCVYYDRSTPRVLVSNEQLRFIIDHVYQLSLGF